MAKTVDVTVELVMNSPKEHSVRYDADSKSAALQSIYVPKKAFQGEGNFPSKITVTIKA
jgi:hypothetical protein